MDCDSVESPQTGRLALGSKLAAMADEILGSVLLERLRVSDPALTGDQLRRWHRAELIPRPRQVGLGHGLGSDTIYPLETEEIAATVITLLRERRDLSWVGWKLWLMDFPVAEKYWLPSLEVAASQFDGLSPKVRALLDSDVSDVEENEELHLALQGPQPNRLFRSIRKALGPTRLVSAVLPFVEMIAGYYDGPSKLELRDPDYKADRTLMDLVLGFTAFKTSERPRVQGLSTSDYLNVLAQFGKALSAVSWSAFLDDLGGEELRCAKIEIVNVIALLNLLSQLEAQGDIPRSLGLKRAGMLRASLSSRELPGLILGWAIYRRQPGVVAAATAFRKLFADEGIPVELNLERTNIDTSAITRRS